MRILAAAACVLAAFATGCRSEPPPAQRSPKSGIVSPQARWDLVDFLRQDLEAKRHPADGGGRAWLDGDESTPSPVTARTRGHWTIIYEAGELGVAAGGTIFFVPSPFWGWSAPQTSSERAPGYTKVTTAAKGVELKTEVSGQPMLSIGVAGRALKRGEQVRIAYGAGEAGAIADRFAEHGSRFWIAVDGDGDGVRKYLADSPAVDVVAGPPARLMLTLPTTARPGARARLTVAVVDALGNGGCGAEGEVNFDEPPAGLDLPPGITLSAADEGHKTITFVPRAEGVYRLRASGPLAMLSAESNPMVVASRGPRVWWGDLQGHSGFSDGSGTPEDYFRYARDVAALDIVALTDHDHWGILALDQHPEMWAEVKKQVKQFYAPGRFVTLLGYEWTSWIHGHRHVLYFGDEGKVISSLDPRYESPPQLWAALRGQEVITVAHHSAGGPIATNWSIPPNPELEPVTEIVSVHGVSEAPDSPGMIYDPVPGNFVRDALDRGYKLGFIGSGDGHDGHPGLVQLAAASGGLAAVITDELTRAGVYRAFRARRVYATNGPRLLLRFSLDGYPMGSVVAAAGSGRGQPSPGTTPPAAARPRLSARTSELFVRVVAPAVVERVELVRSGRIADTVASIGEREFALHRTIEDLHAGEYLYLRVVQKDGGLAWSSPIFIE